MAALRKSRLLEWGLAAALLAGAGVTVAQIEGGDRGAAPIDSSSDFEVTGITVDVAGKDAESARLAGWRIAQRKGWTMLAQRLTGSSSSLADGALDSIVTGIVIENEQIGPDRYIARLGILFDRTRAGQILGVATQFSRSAPMLVIPVMWSGGSGQVFERSTPWQEAWARYRTGASVVDYVRPVGTGADPLLLNVGQTGRRGRGWWRAIMDQYGASDVVMPEVRLYRQYPGGPVIGVFTAFHGPDRRALAQFTLRVANGDALPQLLDAGVARLDEVYQQASRGGAMIPDALLAPPPTPEEAPTPTPTPTETARTLEDIVGVGGTSVQVQFDTPSSGSVTAGEVAVRGVPGVRSAVTSSLALGGISVMRVTYDGDIGRLKAALEARGWSVQEGPGTLRIRRAAAPAAPLNPAPPPGN
ncbi:heavy-metal-associated domain-containing protein [Sphingomonas sp.]|uniref:heavy-metal-associated domain-containing protein n=1 Tax=Sphingomonas sp. TaxID=28214 RepID=UPI002DD6390F|nr:heavy-metal-associated domain-containing protein [Sphingomonas sp.]